MDRYTILVGNDINNISPGVSWGDLLHNIKKKYNLPLLANGSKPFPMLYEEIFLHAIKKNNMDETELKIYIGEEISRISPNEIHSLIRELPIANILTTNYEFSLEAITPELNNSLVRETVYSVFRQYEVGSKTYWHIHGDCNVPASINLGYEHYCGQLQKMRDYVVNAPNYSSKKIHKESLIRRLKMKGKLNLQSWIDLFFTHDVHIFGLSLDFVEIDLWWLLTYRARSKYYKKGNFIKNKLYYYTPLKYVEGAMDKIQLLKANDVEVIEIDIDDKAEYYKAVIDGIRSKYD
ncbi:hypothetical protein SAMN05660841_00032 [Sphingobacterium nematocida]|uniref:SIR2-like domain-containing protein n=1 Tax=Sphingobacterium nematocida TaxID=1513896 RepID=A0A1T5AN95_9SPHI|nr:hypothetical protein [Sphingobacterium nematocida]SKB36436.1 hypothetical protein SAMN05660841_00032 [Sphingobacterium nematocida]